MVSKIVAITIGAVVQRTFIAIAKDEVPRYPISSEKKINTFPIKTTKENCIVLNTVQFNITFQIATV